MHRSSSQLQAAVGCTGDRPHPELIVDTADQQLTLHEQPPHQPWLPLQLKQPLAAAEFTIEFFVHGDATDAEYDWADWCARQRVWWFVQGN